MRRWKTILFALTMLLSTAALAQAPAAGSFTEFVKAVTRGQNTEMAIDSYWQSHRGTMVTWSGTVHNVRARKGRAEIYVFNEDNPSYKGYNIIVISYETNKAAQLKIGDKVTFKGTLHKYKNKHTVVATVMNAQIL